MRWVLAIACASLAAGCGGGDEAVPHADDGGVAHDAPIPDAAIPDAAIPDATIPDAFDPDAEPGAVCWNGEPLDPGPPPDPWPVPDAGTPPVIVCASNDDCPSDMYCRPTGLTGPVYDQCASGTTHVCAARPAACPELEPDDLPICGCDGAWHASSCHAELAGVKPGANSCGAPPPGYHACGTLACRSGVEYCLASGLQHGQFEYSCHPLQSDTSCASLEAQMSSCFEAPCTEHGCREIRFCTP